MNNFIFSTSSSHESSFSTKSSVVDARTFGLFFLIIFTDSLICSILSILCLISRSTYFLCILWLYSVDIMLTIIIVNRFINLLCVWKDNKCRICFDKEKICSNFLYDFCFYFFFLLCSCAYECLHFNFEYLFRWLLASVRRPFLDICEMRGANAHANFH